MMTPSVVMMHINTSGRLYAQTDGAVGYSAYYNVNEGDYLNRLMVQTTEFDESKSV